MDLPYKPKENVIIMFQYGHCKKGNLEIPIFVEITPFLWQLK